MKLLNPTDDQLNAAFAERVAVLKVCDCGGWTHLIAGASMIRFKDCKENCCPSVPKYCSSADSVLPWLEKWNESWEVAYYSGTWNFAKERPKGDGSMMYGWVKDKSFPHAAVIALLRANGVEVVFDSPQ